MIVYRTPPVVRPSPPRELRAKPRTALPIFRTVSTTEMTTFRRCQREHHIRYPLGYAPKQKAHPLRFGTLTHRGLEAWWLAVQANQRGGEPVDPLLAALDAMQPRAEDGDLAPFDYERARAMLVGYHVRWIDEPLEVLGVEVQFVAPIVDPSTGEIDPTLSLGGKIDALVRDLRTGRIYTVEHKSASGDISPGSIYWKKLRMDPQISIYGMGARALASTYGYAPDDVAGCIYDVLGKPGHEPYKATPAESRKWVAVDAAARKAVETDRGAKWADISETERAAYADAGLTRLSANQRAADETPEEYGSRVAASIAEAPDRWYVRGEVVRLEIDDRDAEFDVWVTTRAIRAAELSQRAPRNPDACLRFGSAECDFFRVCTREASLDDATRFKRRERTKIVHAAR